MKEFNSNIENPNIEKDGQFKIDFDKEVEVAPVPTPSPDKEEVKEDIYMDAKGKHINENSEDLYERTQRNAAEIRANKNQTEKKVQDNLRAKLNKTKVSDQPKKRKKKGYPPFREWMSNPLANDL